MKRFMIFILCIVFTVTFASVGFAGGKKEVEKKAGPSGKVVYYTAGGAQVAKAIIKAFNERYPQVTVEMVVGGSGELLSRIKAEQGNPQGDVYRASVEAFDDSPELFESYKVKEHNKFPKDCVGKDNKYYAYTTAIMLFIVNTDLMPREKAPQSWKDLGNPEYKGKIVMSHPALSGSGYRQLAQLIQLHGWDLAEKVIANTTFVPKSRLVYTNVAKGESPMGLTEESKPYRMAKDGYPVIALYPKEGIGMSYGAVGVVNNPAHPENARLFMDFICSRKGHEIAVEIENRRSPRPDVKAPEKMPPTKELKFFDFDRIKWAKERDEVLKKFEEVFNKVKD